MLPTSSKGRTPSNVRPNPVFPQYLRRIVKWQQMDIEYTFWQMLHLCTSPKVVFNFFEVLSVVGGLVLLIVVIYLFFVTGFWVELGVHGDSYQHTKYHKQTKNQWARDDPAFIVICSLLLMVATSAFCAAYDYNLGHAVFTVLSVVIFHFIVIGVILATCCWFLTNSYLREEASNSHVVEQRVEWLYAFDVHCNSFFPTFVILYVIQYFLSPLLIAHGFIPILLSNLLFMVAISYYHYLNFLGYDVLPFLEKTTFFLYPIGLVIIISPIAILSGFNPSRYAMGVYFG